MYFDGQFSHAVRKAPILRRGEGSTSALFAPEKILWCDATVAQRGLAEAALAALPFARRPLYARVDLIDDDAGAPCVLELELTEPSLFFAYSAGAAMRCAQAILQLT